VIKIVLTGPESTGKSTLSRALAAYFGTIWTPEYARYYLNHLSRPYLPEDILHIAQAQVQWEAVWEKYANGLLFCDTDLLVPKIWMEHKYGFCDPWIDAQLRIRPYDLYLLCNIDMPWEDDPLREHPNEREVLFEKYVLALEAMNAKYAIISGKGAERLNNAIAASETVLGSRKVD
jgi:NadR type nicotinamide-nucleotide adenylyltransferase